MSPSGEWIHNAGCWLPWRTAESDFFWLGVGGTVEAQGFTVLISIPNDSYSHLDLRSLPLKDSEVPDLFCTGNSFSIIMNLRDIYWVLTVSQPLCQGLYRDIPFNRRNENVSEKWYAVHTFPRWIILNAQGTVSIKELQMELKVG